MINEFELHKKYLEIEKSLGELSSEHVPKNLGSVIKRAYYLFSGGYIPELKSSGSDFKDKLIGDLENYGRLVSNRRSVDIAGGKREITLENEVLDSLFIARDLAENLLLPFFHEPTEFSNKIFKDIHYLSLAYVHAIVNSVAEEYVDAEEAVDAKLRAVNLAKQAIRLHKSYRENRFGEETKNIFSKFKELLSYTQPQFLRSFELTPISEKKITHSEQIMNDLEGRITEMNPPGKFAFQPSFILPIAQGGIELGIRITNAFEDNGYSPGVYPLLYSIKTRKHKRPWIQNDLKFLGSNLEGKDFLVTEDWVTTGNTLRGILNEIEKGFPHEIRVATIKRDPEKSKIPLLDKYSFYVRKYSPYLGTKTDSLSDMKNK